MKERFLRSKVLEDTGKPPYPAGAVSFRKWEGDRGESEAGAIQDVRQDCHGSMSPEWLCPSTPSSQLLDAERVCSYPKISERWVSVSDLDATSCRAIFHNSMKALPPVPCVQIWNLFYYMGEIATQSKPQRSAERACIAVRIDMHSHKCCFS